MSSSTLITGAAGGIGRAVARRVLAAGGRVALLDSDHEQLERVAAELGAGDRVATLPTDVTDAEAVQRSLAAATARFGTVDHAVCAAGVLRPATVLDGSPADWEHHLQVNATGTFHTLRAVVPPMIDRRRGAVVVVGSNAAQVPRRSMAAYAASKAAAAALTRCLGLEAAPYGVRCNVVEPGSTDTGMQRDLWRDPDDGARRAVDGDPAEFRLGIPLGRIAEPDDVAGVITFLLSDDARHVTLQRVLVDGGASL
ncbi:2,3-dihydro-2,3-dihydroxybenzoate dehydrogenase [Mumia flava]|uniref:2,3-dihydro-2,3-dihydroxybenzoate dehydrogenase n=1 Tax=Mumia flava TaxID=1348852 RepID=A0A2M9BK67_9ACTN|nr:2,3-dihydro-2,3-dihydroxybenzoate dehydrogenase [Mumia flava]PJJ58337.1 2,3-dihydro-2,3-dihydroxybenzoate dehydrogenase [Mumia flava]